MTVVQFYESLSAILGDYRISEISKKEAVKMINVILEQSKESGLELSIDIEKLLEDTKSAEYDEENSYDGDDESYEPSYDEDDEE